MHALKQKQLGAFFRAALIIVLLLSSGCGVFFHATSQQRPFTPSNTNGDLVMVRTGDQQYYYIVDKKRGVCFFHAKMYGRTHLVNLPCEDIPEYGDIMGMTAANTQSAPTKAAPEPREPPAKAPLPSEPKKVSPAPPAPSTSEIGASEMNKVEIAFAELQCKRRKGEVEPLEDLLIRHDLTLDTWESAMSELQAKPEAWTKLHDKAAAQCAP